MKYNKDKKRISYESYAYLRSLVERDMAKLEADFHLACWFLTSHVALGEAHKHFLAEHHNRRLALEELHLAASSMYKDHPNPEMRKFWDWQNKQRKTYAIRLERCSRANPQA